MTGLAQKITNNPDHSGSAKPKKTWYMEANMGNVVGQPPGPFPMSLGITAPVTLGHFSCETRIGQKLKLEEGWIARKTYIGLRTLPTDIVDPAKLKKSDRVQVYAGAEADIGGINGGSINLYTGIQYTQNNLVPPKKKKTSASGSSVSVFTEAGLETTGNKMSSMIKIGFRHKVW